MRKVSLLGLLLLLVNVMCICSFVETHYTRKECKVVECNKELVTVVDKCGFLWDFKAEDLKLGDTVTLKMHTNYTTEDIFDDIILDYKETK